MIKIISLGLLSASVVLIYSDFAHAYSFTDNRSLFPIGESEAFMANTGVALGGSTGAVYFNPAGLASLKKNHVSLSGDTYLSSKTSLMPVETVDSTDLNLTATGFQAVPSSIVSTWNLGSWVAAFSVLVPNQIKNQDVASYSTPNYSTLQIARTDSFQLLWAGFSAATQFSNSLDVGAGCFYSRYQTTQQLSWDATPTVASGLTSALVIDSYFNATVDGFLCDVGMQMQYSSDFRVGFSAHLPFITMSSTGDAYSFFQSPQSGAAIALGPKSVSAAYQIPLDTSLGLEYLISEAWRIYFDISYQFASNYQTGDLNASPTDEKAVARYNLGMSYKLNQSVQLLAGVAYNPSAINLNSSNAAEDFKVGTVGVNFINGISNVGVGLMYAESSGSSLNQVVDSSAHLLETRTGSISTQAFGIMINSGFVF